MLKSLFSYLHSFVAEEVIDAETEELRMVLTIMFSSYYLTHTHASMHTCIRPPSTNSLHLTPTYTSYPNL